MIRDYIKGDLERIKENKHSRMEIKSDKFIKDFEQRENYTLYRDDEIMMIFSYKQYAPKRYTVYMVLSKYFDVVDLREAKKLWDKGVSILEPIRIETISEDDEQNNKFHRFIGFEKEGTKRNYLDGKDYIVWGILWQSEK